MTEDVREFAEMLRVQNAKLDDIIKHGSKNFQRYRRRATIVLVFLTATNAYTGYLQYHSQAATARAAKAACMRSQKVGPPLIDGLERHRIMPAKWIRIYRDSIPASCPK